MNPSDSPVAGSSVARKPLDPRPALQWFLVLDAGVRLGLWSVAFAVATAATGGLGLWPDRPPLVADLAVTAAWGRALVVWCVLFNLAYVALLVVCRLPIPTPREGRYDTTRPIRLTDPAGRQIVWSCLVAVLTKARYEAPFPGFLVFHVANLPPMRWLMGPIFGPRSRSCYVTDPRILDPHMVTIGRNVVVGFGSSIAGHWQERDAVTFQRTVIEDDVLIGGHAVIYGGVTVRRGSTIGGGAVVLPGTTIGPNEFWAGIPARKLRDMPPP